MRSVLLVILSALLCAGGFLAYWTSQPASQVSADRFDPGPVKAPSTRNAGPNGFMPGDAVWLREFDQNPTTPRVTSEFKGDHFTPRPNGTIDVTNPVARFFLAGNQHIEVTGVTGNVLLKEMPNLAGKTGLFKTGPTSPPSRGRLDDVVVKLIDETTNAPVLTMKTRNVVFDNDTFRISTERYRDENGAEIADDQVPVHIVGQESGQSHSPYLKQMEGRGLTVRWNDRDGRLELLEIAHGDFLIIDNATSPVLPGSQPKTATATALAAPLSAMLASTDPRAAGQVIAPATAQAGSTKQMPRSGRPTVIYRATFFDNVRINQPDPAGGFDQVLIDNVNQMDVDFLLGNGGSSANRAPQLAATQPAATQPAASMPAGNAPAPSESSTSIAEHGKKLSATQPAPASRILVHWTGRLLMTPLMTRPWAPLRAGEGAVKLIGMPVHMHRIDPSGGGFEDIRSATALYATGGDRVQLDHSRQFPLIYIDRIPPAKAKDQRQTHLLSYGQVQYARDTETAQCIGPGTAEVPMEAADSKTPPATMHAKWDRLAEFSMSLPAGGSQMMMHEGHFAGAVDIQHPRMALRSELLDLYFDQVKTRTPRGQTSVQQTLKQAVATTKVFCQFTGEDGKKQSIEGDRIVVDTAFDTKRKKTYASHVAAAGSVHAFTDQELRADNLDAVLKPSAEKPTASHASTRKSDPDAGAVELEKLIAWGSVTAKSKDGSIATGDKLTVTTNAGKQHAILSGANGAKVINPKGNLVTGPEIQFDSGDGRAYVIGAGRMEALQTSKSTTQPAEKITVTWTVGAQFDGNANRIDATGGVVAEKIDARGFHDIGKADRVRVDLAHKADDASTTQPSAQLAAAVDSQTAAATAGATTRPSDTSDSGQMNLFKDKEVVAITLEGKAQLTSTLPAPDGSILQQMVLEGPRIIDREVSPEGSRDRTVSVPSAGRMLVRDHRPSNSPHKGEGGDVHGAIMFTWQRSLVYSKATQRAEMAGDVAIKYDPSDGDPTPALVRGDRMIAYFDDIPATPAKASSAQKPAAESPNGHLRLVSIFGSDSANVSVLHGVDEMVAREVDFDPTHHLLTARGTPQNPVFFYNGSTLNTQAQLAQWDTVTWNPRFQGTIIQYHPHADTSTPKPKSK